MPPAIGHGIVAVERSGDAAWIAMRDVQAELLAPDARLSREQSRRILDAAAQLHRAFRDRVPDGAASLSDRIGMSTPAVADAERAEPRPAAQAVRAGMGRLRASWSRPTWPTRCSG